MLPLCPCLCDPTVLNQAQGIHMVFCVEFLYAQLSKVLFPQELVLMNLILDCLLPLVSGHGLAMLGAVGLTRPPLDGVEPGPLLSPGNSFPGYHLAKEFWLECSILQA